MDRKNPVNEYRQIAGESVARTDTSEALRVRIPGNGGERRQSNGTPLG